MKRILSLAVILSFAWAANAQVADNSGNMSDSSRHHFMHRNWNRDGRDSVHRQFSRNRDQAMNHFGEGSRRDRFRSFGRNQFGWARAAHLHYSTAQREQMRSINKDYRKKSQDLYKQDNLKLGEYKSQLLALQKERKQQMQNLLTPEQKASIQKWQQRVSEEMQVKSAANLERLKIRLNLTEDQAAKLKSQQADFHAQMLQIHKNDNLLPYQKKDQIKNLIAKRQDAVKSVLTPEQYSQFEKMRSQRFGERFERNSMN